MSSEAGNLKKENKSFMSSEKFYLSFDGYYMLPGQSIQRHVLLLVLFYRKPHKVILLRGVIV